MEYEKSIDTSMFVKDGFDVVVFVLLIAAGSDYLRDLALRKPMIRFRLIQSLTVGAQYRYRFVLVAIRSYSILVARKLFLQHPLLLSRAALASVACFASDSRPNIPTLTNIKDDFV